MASIAPMSTQKQEDSLSSVFPALKELAAKTQWVVYCLEPDKSDPTRLTKVPYNARTGYKASTTNPKHWSTYTQARKALEHAHNVNGKTFDGIGFVFCGDYTGIDFDHCIDEQGHIDAWAKSEIEHLNSYSEISQSGEGVHVIVSGLLPEQTNGKGKTSRPGKKVLIRGKRHPSAAIEMYCEGRFFVMTGKHVEGTPTTIRDGLPQALYDRLTTQRSTQDSDDALLEMASRNGKKFHALFWEGDTSAYSGDDSAADQALCNYLAFYTRGDAARMDRLFRRSALMRAKWDRAARNGETYGQGTIRRAILDAPVQGCQYGADNGTSSNEAPHSSKLEQGRRFSDIQEKEIEWFWEKWIPRGKITMLDAMPDQGKSVFCTTLAAAASTGGTMPDGTPSTQGAVIMVNLEDDAADTVKPRLLAAAADVSQVIDLSSVRTMGEDGEIVERPFQLPRDLPLLEEQIITHGAVLVCLDPLMAILDASLKSSNDQDVRQALTPLARILERTRCACLIVRHFNKGSSENALIRGAGSMGIVGAARSQLFVTPDPDNLERHILALGKHNLSRGAPNLIYRIVSDAFGRPCIQWEGTSGHSTAELLSTAKPSVGRQEIRRILREADTPLGALDIVEHASSNLTYEQARQLLSRMSKVGEIVSPSRGLYTLPSQSSQLSQPSQPSQVSQLQNTKKNTTTHFSDCDTCGNDCDTREECHNHERALEDSSEDVVTNVTVVTEHKSRETPLSTNGHQPGAGLVQPHSSDEGAFSGLSEERKAVLVLLIKGNRPMGAKELAQLLSTSEKPVSAGTMRKRLFAMKQSGQVKEVHAGTYRALISNVTGNGSLASNVTNSSLGGNVGNGSLAGNVLNAVVNKQGESPSHVTDDEQRYRALPGDSQAVTLGNGGNGRQAVTRLDPPVEPSNGHCLPNVTDVGTITPETSTNYPYDVIGHLRTLPRVTKSSCIRGHVTDTHLPWYHNGEWEYVCDVCYGRGLRATNGRQCFVDE